MKVHSQIKFLSENYSALHGLNAVPVGLALFLISLWANVVQNPIKNIWLPIAFLLGFLLLSWVIDQYYKNTFGEVRPTPSRRRMHWIAQTVCGLLGLVAYWVDITLGLPISFIGLLFALMFLFDEPTLSVPLDRFSAIRFVASICIVFVSVAPMLFGKSWWNIMGVRTTIIGVTMSIGMLMALQGVMWHFFFVRLLPVEDAKDE